MPALSSIMIAGVGGLSAAAGAISGASDRKSSQQALVRDPGEFERRLREAQSSLFSQLDALVNADGQDSAVSAQRTYNQQLSEMSRTGGLPGQSDIAAGQNLAQQFYAPQQESLRQSFEQQSILANRDAARLGREINDPILRAKLAQDQTRQQALLASQQGAAAAQISALLPQQRLGYAEAAANRAFNLRNSLLSIGNTLSQQERQARQFGAQHVTTQHGSFAQALQGGLSGLASGLSAGASLGSLFGGASAAAGAVSGGAVSPSVGQLASNINPIARATELTAPQFGALGPNYVSPGISPYRPPAPQSVALDNRNSFAQTGNFSIPLGPMGAIGVGKNPVNFGYVPGPSVPFGR